MRRLRWFTPVVLTVVPVVLLAGVGGVPSAASPVYVIRFAMATTPQDITSQSQIAFKKQVESLSHGQVSVELFFGEQLGSTKAQLDQVRGGTLQMDQATSDWFAQYYPPIQILSLPMIFPDYTSAHKAVDGPVIQKLSEAFLERTGFRVLNWESLGGRVYFNRRHAITRRQDFTGLKLRIIPSPIAAATSQAFGAEPVTVEWKELYEAIQQGVVDGADAPLTNVYTTKLYEVAPYISLTNHVMTLSPTVINAAFFASLPPNLQTIIRDAAHSVANAEWDDLGTYETTITKTMIERGAKINALSPAARQDLRASVRSVWEQFKQKLGPDAARWIDQLSTSP